MSLKPFEVIKLTNAGMLYDTAAIKFRFLRLNSVSPANANLQIQLKEEGDEGGLIPFDFKSRVMKSLTGKPYTKLFITSDQPNTLVSFIIGLDDWLVEDFATSGGGAPVTVVEELQGTNLDGPYDTVLAAGVAGNVGGWTLAKTRRIAISLAPGAPNGVYLQSHTSHGAFAIGTYIKPSDPPLVIDCSDQTGPQGLFYFYNPGTVGSVQIFCNALQN